MLNKYPDKGMVFPFPTCKLFFHLFTEHNLRIYGFHDAKPEAYGTLERMRSGQACPLGALSVWERRSAKTAGRCRWKGVGAVRDVSEGRALTARTLSPVGRGAPHLAHPRSLRVWARVHSGG